MIHHTAIIDKTANIAKDVVIGPFCVIGKNVILEEGVILKSHVVIENSTRICKNTIIYSFVTLGTYPQNIDLKIASSSLVIGENNVIREHVNINAGDQFCQTIIGNNCFIMSGVFIAHNAHIGDDVILSNKVEVGNNVKIGSNSVVHSNVTVAQFMKIGEYASISANIFLQQNVLPFALIYDIARQITFDINMLSIQRVTSNEDYHSEAKIIFKEILDHGVSDQLHDIMQYKDQHKYNPIVNKIFHFINLHNIKYNEH